MTATFRPTIPPVESKVEKAEKGPGTRCRVLDAAAELFAARGFANVPVREVCEKAGANIAAVNYHFGGKDKLHIAVMDHARQRALKEDPYPAGPPPSGAMTGEQKLRRHLRAMLGRAFATGPAGWYMQIVLREMVDPSPALHHALKDNIAPHQRKLEGILGQVMGEDPDSEAVQDVAAALLGAAIYYHSCRPAVEHMRPGFAFNQATAERLTDMLMSMVLGGVGAERV